jgi:uncharacterized membrane protein YeiH
MIMAPASEPLTTSILAIMYFGDVVFAVSGALTAARYRMDVLGFVLIGTITGIGGGTTRDLLLGRTVWWTQDPFELSLCVAASLVTFFFITSDITRRKGMIWADALGLAAFGVVGCYVAHEFGAPFGIAVFMGMVTATGGGVIRDVLTQNTPMIMRGQLYATAALLGSLSYAACATWAFMKSLLKLWRFWRHFRCGLRPLSLTSEWDRRASSSVSARKTPSTRASNRDLRIESLLKIGS